MRKIKVSKKDIEKKKKAIAKLLAELLDCHMNKHDRKRTIEIADEILEAESPDVYPVEKATSICVDLNEADRAAKGSEYMEKNFPPSGYRMFLKARVYDLRRDYANCIKYAEEALTIPGSTLLTTMMIHNILGHAYRYIGDAPKSIEHYYKSSMNDISGAKNDPSTYKYLFNIKCDDYSNYLFSLHNINISREDLFDAICKYNDIFKDLKPFEHDRLTHPKHDKIRIGYVSPDIRRHVVAFFSYAFYKSYDKSKFEVYCYARCPEDNTSQEFKQSVDHWTNILFEDAKTAAQKIKDDEIDILVDLSGHTANNVLQIMAHKPAPIQISAIGWFNSTGLKTIDYFLADKFTDPEGLNDKFFTEKILRLQHSHFCYMWHDAPIEVGPAPCVKNGYITFVSFNNFAKVTDETLQAWGKILNAVPNSKLFLKGKAFRTQRGIDEAIERMEAAGISKDRVRIEADELKYLHKYADTDIALDTFPYPGGGTTCDALYMGIPVITLVGERHNARFGYSLLHNMGLDELCTYSEEEYIQKTIDLANDWDKIKDYHLTLRRRMKQSPIMDDTIYMGEIETAYEKIYNAWINGEELPDFPQEEPEITPAEAEQYYQKALGYINAESTFNQGLITNIVNIKRSKYWFDKASQVNHEHLAENYLFLARTKHALNDFAGAYESICQIEPIQNTLSDELKKIYVTERANLALLAGKPADAANQYNQLVAQSPNMHERALALSKVLNTLNFLNISNEEMLKSSLEYQNCFGEVKPYETFNSFEKIIKGERRIKIGYLAPYFRKSEMFPFIYGLAACLNRNMFELTCYDTEPGADPFTQAIAPRTEHFKNIASLSPEKAAEVIHNDGIDILIDLAGHSTGKGLLILAYKPAPVQICGIGALSTTGLKTVDFFMTDRFIDQSGVSEKFFSENLIYLPSLYAYASNSDAPACTNAPVIKNGYVTFGAFHSYKNLSDEILLIWKEILNRMPNARLLLQANEFISDSLIDAAYERLKNLGLNMDQVTFQPLGNDYMKKLLEIDIALDSYPNSNAAMTCDALFMGVPVLSLYGERRSSRLSSSILKNAGIAEFAMENPADYIARAVAIANDKDTLNVLHNNLRTMLQKATILAPNNYMRVLEQCFNQIIRVDN